MQALESTAKPGDLGSGHASHTAQAATEEQGHLWEKHKHILDPTLKPDQGHAKYRLEDPATVPKDEPDVVDSKTGLRRNVHHHPELKNL